MQITDPENPHIRRILDHYRPELGKYAARYTNHALRVYRLTLAFYPMANETDRLKIAVAAAFHDIGIWTHHTFDYLKPSIALARNYLAEQGLEAHADEVAALIDNHHKLTPYRDNALVESFRRADLVDLSLNHIRFGLKRSDLRALNQRYPYMGFHRFIFGQIVKNVLRHSLRPLPILKG